MERQFGNVPLNLDSDDGFLVRPQRYSWQEVAEQNRQDQLLSTDMAKNACSAVDIIIAVLNEEMRQLRQWIPRFNLADLLVMARNKIPKIKLQSLVNFMKWFTGTPNRTIQGNDVNIDLALAKLDTSEDFTNSFSDDDDDSIRAASTVCSAVANEKINELEAQLKELQETLKLIMNQNGVVLPAKKEAKSVIPPVSKAAPPPPPPPPPSFFQKKKSPEPPKDPSPHKTEEVTSSDENKPPVPAPRVVGFNLKELGSVKLKKVARTPGGTPIRPSHDHDKNFGFLARAIKEKFRNTGETDDEPETHDDWDDEETKKEEHLQ
ncbi:unnamed protein product [Bursaphelenchus okinawaensis]|uniref:Uncharacterized protein n=1 Tax=Bursaphelenchus okinawaensis TaxID=465554 RepID=A0A811KY45_9BILA|nr:unnamed protein product [Bursaphelenchus okinawaensis]CAG9113597.1 unnamed protein product [Bursaphelenchus okinawaensis]